MYASRSPRIRRPLFVSPQRPLVVMALVARALLAPLAPLRRAVRLADEMEQPEQAPQRPATPVLSRPPPNYPGHVPLHPLEKLVMFVGSSLGAYLHPENNLNIVALGESSSAFQLERLKRVMLSHPTGRRLLRERPRITSASLDLAYLSALPPNTLGKAYHNWLVKEGVSPDTREPVRYIDDAEAAYVFQRYRESHDFYHAVTGLPVTLEGEIAVKMFEFWNLGLPFTGLGAAAMFKLGGPARARLRHVYFPWARRAGSGECLLNVYWEELLERDVQELRQELGIETPPDLRAWRKAARAIRPQPRSHP